MRCFRSRVSASPLVPLLLALMSVWPVAAQNAPHHHGLSRHCWEPRGHAPHAQVGHAIATSISPYCMLHMRLPKHGCTVFLSEDTMGAEYHSRVVVGFDQGACLF